MNAVSSLDQEISSNVYLMPVGQPSEITRAKPKPK